MRSAFVVFLCLVGTASATTDRFTRAGRIAVWNDAIVVEMSSFSVEAEGADLESWWSIQQPAGVEQARIDGVGTRKPRLVRGGSLDEQLRAELVEKARRAWPFPALAREKSCPVRVKVGKKLVMLWLDKTSVAMGKSSVFDGECESDVPFDVKRWSCFAHDGGYIVRATLHWSCGGDQHVDRIGFIKQ